MAINKDSINVCNFISDNEKYKPETIEKKFVSEICNNDITKNLKIEKTGDIKSFLRELDELLLRENINGNKYGDISEEQVTLILELLFGERYLCAHNEDGSSEQKINNTLGYYISDMYDSGVHFFEEILQNVDDSIGKSGVDEGELEVEWGDNQIHFKYTDRGFSFYDLFAITSIGNSSKKGDLDSESIGEKGIGFKSIFAVADKVSIESYYYNFDICYYDKENKITILHPNEIVFPNGKNEKKTQLTIYFNKESTDIREELEKNLDDWLLIDNKTEDKASFKSNCLQYSPFLFLKHLSKITYKGETTEIKRDESSVQINDYKYWIYEHELKFNSELIKDRWKTIQDIKGNDSINRPIKIAFPIIKEDIENDSDRYNEIKKKKGLIYSYLPTSMEIDFPVYIHVDVHLKSSRGRITNGDFADGSKWNEYVKNNIKEALTCAYKKIIELYSDDQCCDDIKNIAEKLYIYINTVNCNSENHYFSKVLKEFCETIIEDNIYLAISEKEHKGQFVNINEMIYIPNIYIPHYSESAKDYKLLRSFCLDKIIPDCAQQYSYSFNWYKCLYQGVNKGKRKIANSSWEMILKSYGGIEFFYKNALLDEDAKNKIVIDVLKKCCLTASKPETKECKILFIENEKSKEELKYVIKSRKEIEDNNKFVFLKSTEKKSDNAEYIYLEIFNDKNQKDYEEILKCAGITKEGKAESVVAKIQSYLDNFEENETIYIYKLISHIYSELCFVNAAELNLSILKEDKFDKLKSLREQLSKMVLPLDACDLIQEKDIKQGKAATIERVKLYCKNIAEYVEENKEIGYDIFDMSKIENVDPKSKDAVLEQLVSLLVQLGIKCLIESNSDGFDELTKKIIPDFSELKSNPDTLLFAYKDKCQEYVMEYALECLECYDDACLEDIKRIGRFDLDNYFFMPKEFVFENETDQSLQFKILGPRRGYYGSNWLGIKEFNVVAKNCKHNGNININSSKYNFLDYEKYCGEYNNLKANHYLKKTYNSNQYTSINEYFDLKNTRIPFEKLGEGTELYKSIAEILASSDGMDINVDWVNIWNQVFNIDTSNTSEYHFENIKQFVEVVKNKEIDKYNVVYKKYDIVINDEKNDALETDTDKESIEELNKYLKDKGIAEWAKLRSKCYIYVGDEIENTFIDLQQFERLDRKLDHTNEYEFLILVDKNSKNLKTCCIEQCLKAINIALEECDRDELRDIFGEIKFKKNKQIIIVKDTNSNYIEALFNDGEICGNYKEILCETKSVAPSIWKKQRGIGIEKQGAKEWLIYPYTCKEGTLQGYGYQCPICGRKSIHESITSMAYRIVENGDDDTKDKLKKIPIVACLNCIDMVDCAENITITDLDMSSLIDVIKHFEEVCYVTDKVHPNNLSIMKTLRIHMKIENMNYEQYIKFSYAHMALLSKLLDKSR